MLAVETRDLPWQSNLGFLILLRSVADSRTSAAYARAQRIVASSKISSVTATLVVRVFDVLADILPGEKGTETRDLSLVMANEENEIVSGDRADAAAGSLRGALCELSDFMI